MTELERKYLVDTLENFELMQKDNKKDLDQNASWPERLADIIQDIQYESVISFLRSIISSLDSMAKEEFYDKTRKSDG